MQGGPGLVPIMSNGYVAAENCFPPGGVVPVVALIEGLKGLLIATVFSSFLLPTCVVLFVFSTPSSRRRPSFILNVCAIVLGLTQGTVTAYVTVSTRPRTSLASPVSC